MESVWVRDAWVQGIKRFYYTNVHANQPRMGCNCMKYSLHANNGVTFGMNQYCYMQIQSFTDESLMAYTYVIRADRKFPGN